MKSLKYSFIFGCIAILAMVLESYAQASDLGPENSEEKNSPDWPENPGSQTPLFDRKNFRFSPLDPKTLQWNQMQKEPKENCMMPQYGGNIPNSYYQQDPNCNYQLDLMRVHLG